MSAAGQNAPKLAFIGFGEAGPAIAGGLAEAGLGGITAHDILQADGGGRAVIERRARETGVTPCPSHAAAVEGRDIVISTVTCTDAVEAAGQVAPHLVAGQVYMDVNSVSPVTKKKVQDLIEGAGATFLEAAIMSPVFPRRHASPMLLCGPAAPAVIDKLAPFGMDLTDAGPQFGRASATKMFRSIMIKGIEALLQECVLAADSYGVADEVLDSVGDNHPEIDWKAMADYYLGRTVVHGVRRGHEMEEAAETLRALDIPPFMAEGAARRIGWLAGQGLKEAFGGDEPASYRQILDALKARRD